MLIAETISPHIPYLRRFARALTGSQSGGDAYAIATLETIAADPAAFDTGSDVRAGLYRIFLTLWGSIRLNVQARDEPKSGLAAVTDRSLEAITPRPRVAFLLSALEGFDRDRVAYALGCSPDEASSLIDEAGREIAERIATDVLIIEDEPVIAMDIQAVVERLGHRVAGMARTRNQAVREAERTKPGLILADIQLADGSSGLDAVNDILGSFEVPVVFITAYPERLLTGEKPEPAFLLTKPFNDDTLKAVISQALFFDRKTHKAGSRKSGVAVPAHWPLTS
ncbi:Response regulator receiver domain-containing protein [Rhizobiales bacterium GAS191]|nr:Response regulator receiver domain-containing protein [Rhizobiales bacterium GAS191]